MSKYEVKRVFDELCPEVFVLEEDEEAVFPVVLHDAVVALRGWTWVLGKKAPTDIVTIDDLVRRLFGDAIFRMRETTCYVALFDKPKFVTTAKQPEQRARDTRIAAEKPTSETTDALATSTATTVLSMPAKEWIAAIENRGTRKDILRLACLRAAETLPAEMRKMGVAEDHHIIIDFQGREEDADRLPLVIFPSGERQEDAANYRNEIGEFDVAAMYYLHHPSIQAMMNADDIPNLLCGALEIPSKAHLLLRSPDSDMLLITMMHTDPAVHGDLRAMIQTTLPTPKPKGATATPPPRNVFFHPHRLRRFLTTAMKGGQHPVDDFVRMFILSGTDYVKKPPNITNYKAMHSYIVGRGDLTPEDIVTAALRKPAKRGRVSASKRVEMIDGKEKEEPVPYDLECSLLRTEWCMNYWLHSAWETDKLITSLDGHGFTRRDGRTFNTEDTRGVVKL